VPATASSRAALAGAALCAASAASFGAMAIFGKLAYDAGVTVLTLLTVRFVLAGAVLAIARPAPLPHGALRVKALALGGIGYAAQSALFFSALTRIDAGLAALGLYLYPALVTLSGAALGRDRLDPTRLVALALAFTGVVLVLFVGVPGEVDALGVALALGAAVVYSVYILVSETVLAATQPLALTTLVCLGAATSFTTAALVSGELDLGFDGIGWLWLGAIAAVSTVAAIGLFFAGVARVGPSRASIISTIEPLVTVLLAFLVFDDELAATQLVGGALVLGSVVLLTRSPASAPARAEAP
jgi:drug/metabolite transporter (DMT)-like permease